MIHDSARESVFKRSAEGLHRSHNAAARLCKKMAARERPLRQTHRYYASIKHAQPPLPILTSENRSSAHQPSPQELAESAAIILALNLTSSKKPNQS